MRSRVPAPGRGERAGWLVQPGSMPPLADTFSARPETAQGLMEALVPGAVVVLAPEQAAAGRARTWLGSCGKTQLAVSAAHSLRQSGGLDLMLWVPATNRASVLACYVQAAVAATGVSAGGDAESIAARFARWLAGTDRSWLVVFDDLTDAAVLEGLWPEGRGRVLVTTADPATAGGARETVVLPVGRFSPREALNYLMGRLTADPHQRLGALDLAEDLGREPLALAQASAVIASSPQTCRDYRARFARRREQFAETAGSDPPAAAVTWTLCVDQAERLSPDGAVELLLALGGLLDGQEIPGGVFTAPAACEYFAEAGAVDLANPERAWDGVLSLHRAGLVAVHAAGKSAVVRMSPLIQAAVQAAMPQRMLDQAARAAADALLQVWPDREPVTWLTAPLRSCALSLLQAAGPSLWAGGCHPVLMRAGRSLDQARLTGPAVAWWTELAAVGGRSLGPDHPDTVVASRRLADAHLAAGQAKDAVAARP
jgi:hypothetical protein